MRTVASGADPTAVGSGGPRRAARAGDPTGLRGRPGVHGSAGSGGPSNVKATACRAAGRAVHARPRPGGAPRGEVGRTTVPAAPVDAQPDDLVPRVLRASAPNRLWVADVDPRGDQVGPGVRRLRHGGVLLPDHRWRCSASLCTDPTPTPSRRARAARPDGYEVRGPSPTRTGARNPVPVPGLHRRARRLWQHRAPTGSGAVHPAGTSVCTHQVPCALPHRRVRANVVVALGRGSIGAISRR